ncbi:MAG TPA: hypothetical protein VIO14_07210 [Dehalococcoidia bacterium]
MAQPGLLASGWVWEREPEIAWAASLMMVALLVASYFIRQRIGR